MTTLFDTGSTMTSMLTDATATSLGGFNTQSPSSLLSGTDSLTTAAAPPFGNGGLTDFSDVLAGRANVTQLTNTHDAWNKKFNADVAEVTKDQKLVTEAANLKNSARAKRDDIQFNDDIFNTFFVNSGFAHGMQVSVNTKLAGELGIGEGYYEYYYGYSNGANHTSFLYDLLDTKIHAFQTQADNAATVETTRQGNLDTAIAHRNVGKNTLDSVTGNLAFAKARLAVTEDNLIATDNFPIAFQNFMNTTYHDTLRNLSAYVMSLDAGVLHIPQHAFADYIGNPTLLLNTLGSIPSGASKTIFLQKLDAVMGSNTAIAGTRMDAEYINERNSYQGYIERYVNEHNVAAGDQSYLNQNLNLDFQAFLTTSSNTAQATHISDVLGVAYGVSAPEHPGRNLAAVGSAGYGIATDPNGHVHIDQLWVRDPVAQKPGYYTSLGALSEFLTRTVTFGFASQGPNRHVTAGEYAQAEIDSRGDYPGLNDQLSRKLLNSAVNAMNQTVSDPYKAYVLGSLMAKAAAQLAVAGTRSALLHGDISLPQSLQAAQEAIAAGAAAMGYSAAQRNEILATAGLILAPVVAGSVLSFLAANQKVNGTNVTVSSVEHGYPNIATGFAFASSAIALTTYSANAFPQVYQATKALGVPLGFALSDATNGVVNIISGAKTGPTESGAAQMIGGIVQFATSVLSTAAAVQAWRGKIDPKVSLKIGRFGAGLASGLYMVSAALYASQ